MKKLSESVVVSDRCSPGCTQHPQAPQAFLIWGLCKAVLEHPGWRRHKTRTPFTELGLDNERRCRGKRKNSSSDSSKLHSLMEFYRFQLQVTINPTQTGLTKRINLLAHTKKTPGGGLTSGPIGSRCSNCLSLPLSSAFFCVGSILRQSLPSWQK